MGLGLMHFVRINKNYRIRELIGTGSISEVYLVKDRDGNYRAAQVVNRGHRYLLAIESKVMQELNELNGYGIPHSYFFGRHGNKYVLVMDLLGDSFWNLKQKFGNFSVKSGLLAGIQMTSRVQSLHEGGFVHRNITPHTFFVGSSQHERKVVFLAKYSAVKQFRHSDGNHRLPTWGLPFRGSKDFASRHAHRGERQSRRCDLESVAYAIIYIMKGLPWESLPSNDLLGTANMKERISAEDLCGGLPWEIMRYYCEVRNLAYSECPNYSALRGYLRSSLFRNAHDLSVDFEWNN